MKISLFTIDFTPKDLKKLGVDKYIKQALFNAISEEVSSKPEAIAKVTPPLEDKLGEQIAEKISSRIEDYSKNLINEPEHNSESKSDNTTNQAPEESNDLSEKVRNGFENVDVDKYTTDEDEENIEYDDEEGLSFATAVLKGILKAAMSDTDNEQE